MSKVALYFKRWKNYSRHKSKFRAFLPSIILTDTHRSMLTMLNANKVLK